MMARYFSHRVAAAGEAGGTERRGLSAAGGDFYPLLTVRSSSCFSDDAATAANVGCLCFLSPSLLAAGDTSGCVSFIDLLTRRPLAVFPAAATASCSRRNSSSSSSKDNLWSLYSSNSCTTAARRSWKDAQRMRSPLLQAVLIEGPAETAFSSSSLAAAAAAPLRCGVAAAAAAAAAQEGDLATAAGRRLSLRCSRSSSRKREETEAEEADTADQEAAVYGAAAGDVSRGRQLLLQQKSSLLSLWDLDCIAPCCRFSTGAYSFCKFTLLQEPQQPSQQYPQQTQQQQPSERKEEHEDQQQQEKEKDKALIGSTEAASTDNPGSEAASAGALLVAAPVADAEAIGVFDFRCCRQTSAAQCVSHSSSNLEGLSVPVAKPAVVLKPTASGAAAASALGAFPTPAAAAYGRSSSSSLGAVHALATASGSSSGPLLIAAYECPCVALWDLRNNSQPLSASVLPSPAATSRSAAAAPPACLAVYRNQCWVGSFEGDLWVLKLKQRSRTLSAPVYSVNLVTFACGADDTLSVGKGLNDKSSQRHNTSHQLHSVNATPVNSRSNGAAVPAASPSAGGICGRYSDTPVSPAAAAAPSAAVVLPPAAALSASAASSSGVVSEAGTCTGREVASQTHVSSVARATVSARQLSLRSATTPAASLLVPLALGASIVRLPHPDGDVGRYHALSCAAFRPDGAVIGVGTANGVLHLFEAKTKKCLGSLRQQGTEIKALAWCTQTGLFATNAAPGRIGLWDLYADSYFSK